MLRLPTIAVVVVLTTGCGERAANDLAGSKNPDQARLTTRVAIDSDTKDKIPQQPVAQRGMAVFQQAMRVLRDAEANRQVSSQALPSQQPAASSTETHATPAENGPVEVSPAEAESIARSIEALDDANRNVRLQAVQTLNNLGGKARSAMDALEKRLQDEDYQVRFAAANALAGMGAEALPTLKRAFGNARGSVLDSAAGLLRALRGTPTNESRYRNELAARRAVLVQAMGRIGTPSVPTLAAALQDESPKVRVAAAYALGECGSGSREAVPGLMSSLSDADREVRSKAAHALGCIGPAAKAAIPALIETLGSDDSQLSRESSDALRGIGEDAIPALAAALPTLEERLAPSVIQTLGLLGPQATPALEAALYSANQRACDDVARALGAMGPEVKPVLEKALRDERVHIRRAAIAGLSKLGPESVPLLLDALADPEPSVRTQAAGALRASPGVRLVLEDMLLEHEDFEIRLWAAEIYRKVTQGR